MVTANGGEGMRTRNAAPSLQAEEAVLTTIQKAALGMKHLPLDEFFDETDAAMNAATPLPWVWGQHSEPTAEELAAWAATCVGKRDGATMQMAVVDDPETGAESYLQTAMFGNGPRSAANAQLAIAAVNNYPLLRDIIRDRDATIATLREALEEREALRIGLLRVLAAVVTGLGGEYAFPRRILYELDTERTEIVTWESPDSLMQHVAVRLSAALDEKEG